MRKFILLLLLTTGMFSHAQSFDFSCTSSSTMINIPSHQSHWNENVAGPFATPYTLNGLPTDNYILLESVNHNPNDQRYVAIINGQREGGHHEHFWQAAQAFANLNSNWNFQRVMPRITQRTFISNSSTAATFLGNFLGYSYFHIPSAPGYFIRKSASTINILYRNVAYIENNQPVFVSGGFQQNTVGTYNSFERAVNTMASLDPNLIVPNPGSSTSTAIWNNAGRFRYDVSLDTALGATGWRGILVLDDGTETPATSAQVTTSVTGWFTPANVDNLASFRIEYLRNGAVLSSQTFQRPARQYYIIPEDFQLVHNRGNQWKYYTSPLAPGYAIVENANLFLVYANVASINSAAPSVSNVVVFSVGDRNTNALPLPHSNSLAAAVNRIIARESNLHTPALGTTRVSISDTDGGRAYRNWRTVVSSFDRSRGVDRWRLVFTHNGNAQRHTPFGPYTTDQTRIAQQSSWRRARVEFLRADGAVIHALTQEHVADLTWRNAENNEEIQVRLPGDGGESNTVTATFRYIRSELRWHGRGLTPGSSYIHVEISNENTSDNTIRSWAVDTVVSNPIAGGNPFRQIGRSVRRPTSTSVEDLILAASAEFQVIDVNGAPWRIVQIRSDNGLQLRSPNRVANIAIIFAAGQQPSLTNDTGWTRGDYDHPGFFGISLGRDPAHHRGTITEAVNAGNSVSGWPRPVFD